MDQLLNYFHSTVRALSHGDPLASAGVTMWLLTVVGFMARRLPRLLYMKIRAKFIVRMVMNKTGESAATAEQRNFLAFLLWFDKLPSSKYDRNRKPNFTSSGNVRFLPGYGFHWFWYDGRYYWFYLKEIDSQGIEAQKEQINLYTFGVSLKPLEKIIDAFKIVPDKDVLKIWVPSTRGSTTTWVVGANIPTKDRPKSIHNDMIRTEIFDRVQEFLVSEQWYRSRGLAYKTTIMLMGPPGTGKTSIARDLAIEFNLRLHELNLHSVGDRGIREALVAMKPGGILLIDDFEDIKALHRRIPLNGEERSSISSRDHITLSGFLGALDGAIPLDNVIVILNTNHPQLLDPAIYRPGRVDHKVVVGPLEEDKVCQFVERMYGQPYTGRVEPTVVAALAGVFNRNKHNFEGFCEEYVEYLDGTLKLDQLEFNGEIASAEEARQPVLLESP